MPNETQDTQSETQQPASGNATGVAEPTVDQLQARVQELEAQAGIYAHLFAHYNEGLDLAQESQWVRQDADGNYHYRSLQPAPSSTEQVPATEVDSSSDAPPTPVGQEQASNTKPPQLKVVPAPPNPATPVVEGQGDPETGADLDKLSEQEFVNYVNESLVADRNKQDRVSVPAQAVANS